MQRMNGIDPMFVYSQTPSTPMEVAYACILDPSTARDGYSFESVKQLLSERLPSLVPFRRRLMAVPFGLDHPRWVDDPEFDLDNHLHRAAAPAPGGEAEFTEMVAAILGRPLCPDQPPWEMHIVEGLAGDKVGLVAKVHHAAIDGVAGAQLLAQLLDLTPEGGDIIETPPTWAPPALPSSIRLISDAVPKLLTSPIRSLVALREVGRTAVRMARRAVDRESAPLSIPLFAPDALSTRVVPDRVVALAELDLAAIKEIRQRFDVTINDVVLAICSGALRSHLTARGDIGDSPLVAIVPVSVRCPEGDDALGNRLSAMFVPLANDLDDPGERLAAIASSSAMTKAQEQAIGYGPMASALADSVPPALSHPLIYAGTRLGALRRFRAGNLMVSNVPGPDFPLYFAGMHLQAVHPFGPVVDGVALNITVQSYDGSLYVGINASATVIHDVPALARAMVEELKALMEAASEEAAEVERFTDERARFMAHRVLGGAAMSRYAPRGSVPTAHAGPAGPGDPLPWRADKEKSWD